MRALKRWLDRSVTAQAVVGFLLMVGVLALLRRDAHPVLWVVQAGFYSLIFVVIRAVMRRRVNRAAGTDHRGFSELNRKLRHREVPEEPEEREAMRRLVGSQLGQIKRSGRWVPYWMGFMGLVAIGVLVLGTIAGQVIWPLTYAIFMAGFLYWIHWMRRRTAERHRFMRSALEGESNAVSQPDTP